MISIIIPLYNKEGSIGSTLRTVFNQTFQNFEIVIVNDGSTDKSLDVASSFSDGRIKIVEQKNQGVAAARNRGVHEAKFDYVAFLDADDEWTPDYLYSQVLMIEEYQDAEVFGSAYYFKRSDSTINHLLLNKLPFNGTKGILSNYFEVASYSHPPLWTSAVVVRKKALLSVGGFPVGVIAGEDLLTWAKLALNFKVVYNTIPKAFFCQSESETYLNQPSRVPEANDIVGDSLQKLYLEYPSVVGFRQYISLWYKMRASMILLLGHNRDTLKECCKALKYNILNVKVWIYLCLLLLPLSMRYKVFRKFGHA